MYTFMGTVDCGRMTHVWAWLIDTWLEISTDVILKTALIESATLNIPITIMFVLLSDNSNFMLSITV